MKVLGLHVSGDQSSACLSEDGIVKYGVAEERLNREKRSRKFPADAIKFCFKKAGLNDLLALDAIAVSWNPMVHMELINMSGFTSWRRYDPELLYIVPNNLEKFIHANIANTASVFKWDSLSKSKIYFVNHHLSHLAQAVFQSDFDECAALIADEYGEYTSTTLAKASNNTLDVIRQIPFPHSLGAFYATFTEFLGFRINNDEWKVMGMAAYGNPNRYYREVKSLLSWSPESMDIELALQYFNFYNMKIGTYCSPRMEKLLNVVRRNPDDELSQNHYDLAASVQRVFEETVIELLNSLYELSRCKNLVLGGGIFMNSLLNGKIIEKTAFENIFIPYAAADNGAAAGAALWVSHVQLGLPVKRENYVIPSPYIGPAFAYEEIEDTLKKYKIRYRRSTDPAEDGAAYIASGKIVGWFQGGAEFGERALGNRSILADPRDRSMKDKINSAVKYRETFRPFAPSILEEEKMEYFRIPDNVQVPYMEQVYSIRAEKRSIIPAVTHHDGTGRLQTVSKELNPLFHSLISKFRDITGVPVVLNTSFNVKDEPIVCSPTDALRTFFSCGMDLLIIGNFIISKSNLDI
jgi:carbamoyltransferase